MQGDQCLRVQSTAQHTPVVLGACDGGSKWAENPNGDLVNAAMDSSCLKVDLKDLPRGEGGCTDGARVVVAKCNDNLFKLSGSSIALDKCKPSMCAAVQDGTTAVVVRPCGSTSAAWTKRKAAGP